MNNEDKNNCTNRPRAKVIPSMTRRRIGHDYESRQMYMITLTVEGRRPLLGKVVGNPNLERYDEDAPRMVLSELGIRVEQLWLDIPKFYPEMEVVALQLMPDNLHGILFVRERTGYHLGRVIKGFKAASNKAYREWRAQMGGSAQRHYSCEENEKSEGAERRMSEGAHKEGSGKQGMHWIYRWNFRTEGAIGELEELFTG